MPTTANDAPAIILGEVLRLKRRNASPEAIMMSVHLLERKSPADKVVETDLNLPWRQSRILFSPRTVACWNVSACRSSRFLQMAFAALAYMDDSGGFRRLIARNIASRKIPEDVRALLMAWWTKFGIEDSRRTWNFRALSDDNPLVVALWQKKDATPAERMLRADGIHAGSHGMAALVEHRLTCEVVQWLAAHDCLNTLAYVARKHGTRCWFAK